MDRGFLTVPLLYPSPLAKIHSDSLSKWNTGNRSVHYPLSTSLSSLQIMSDNTGLDWVWFIWLNVDIWNTDVYLQQVALSFLVSQRRLSQRILTCLALKQVWSGSSESCPQNAYFSPLAERWIAADMKSVTSITQSRTSASFTPVLLSLFSQMTTAGILFQTNSSKRRLQSCYLPLQQNHLLLPGDLNCYEVTSFNDWAGMKYAQHHSLVPLHCLGKQLHGKK